MVTGIRNSHSLPTISLFYVKLPNLHLSRISEHGARYSQKFPPEKAKLSQSRPYQMKKAGDQAAFYRVLGNLLWYLASGKSHAGHLTNCPGNPFVAKEVPPLSPVLSPSPLCCPPFCSRPVCSFYFSDISHGRFMIVLSFGLSMRWWILMRGRGRGRGWNQML